VLGSVPGKPRASHPFRECARGYECEVVADGQPVLAMVFDTSAASQDIQHLP